MHALQPRWPAPPGVRAWCGTRDGGVSAAPFDSLNLGDHVGDDPASVAANRARYAQALQARPVYLRQVHSTAVARLDRDTPDGTQADACISMDAGVACTIMVADCLPILLSDDQGRVVGAAHAGWRGLAGEGGRGVAESTVEAMAQALARSAAAAGPRLLAWLGPCIGPTAFEVGPDVLAAFTATDAAAAGCFKPLRDGKWLADLPGLARRRLHALGVDKVHGNDGSAPWCTVTNRSRFFSFRRDGVTGRFAASVWRG
ncbi:MAG: peptidoglycan editing factor PgeF [Pseudomonadota bacterium]